MKVALILLATLAVASAQNFTCVGNPFFNTPYTPNPISPGNTTDEYLKSLGITYNTTTKTYNLSTYTNLTFCKTLQETGSCCSPDVLKQSAKAFRDLLAASSDATVKIFQSRAMDLYKYGKIYGKMLSSLVNVASKIHAGTYRFMTHFNDILANNKSMTQLYAIANATNTTDALNEFVNNGTFELASKIKPFTMLNISYQIIMGVSDLVGLDRGDLAAIFGDIKGLTAAFGSIPETLAASFIAFPSVSRGLVSDVDEKLTKMLTELASRNVTVNLTIGAGDKPNPTPKKALRALAAIITDNETAAVPPTPKSSSSGAIPIQLPYILDSRNIEAIAKVLNDATNKAKNGTEFFTILNNTDALYKAINASFVTDIKVLGDLKTGGNWGNLKAFFIRLGKFIFDDAIKVVSSVAEKKKKCLDIAFKYQGYLGCLACDASAVAQGRLKVNETAGTYSPVISKEFGNSLRANCTPYFKDLIFIKNFITGLRAFEMVSNNEDIAKVKPEQIDFDFTKKPSSNATSLIDYELDIPCSLDDGNCTWIQDKIIDAFGPTPSFLCDFSSAECKDLEYIKGLRKPNNKKNETAPKRILEGSSSATVTYAENMQDVVSTTDVGFTTTPNYTVDSNSTSSIVVDTTTDQNVSNGSNTSNTSNTSNATNTTNGSTTGNTTNGTGKFALKSFVSIPLIIATIIAFLL